MGEKLRDMEEKLGRSQFQINRIEIGGTGERVFEKQKEIVFS